MDRDKIIEQSVSDAITAKPIRFSVTYTQSQDVDVEHTERVALHRLLPFLHKQVKRTEVETRDVEMVRDFEIHPPTLGKMQTLAKLYLQLDLNETILQEEPHKEAMRVCEKSTDIVCLLMAVCVSQTEKELLNDKELNETALFFKWHCMPDDFANCLLAMLTQVDYSAFMTSIRLTKMLRQNKPTEKRADRIEQ